MSLYLKDQLQFPLRQRELAYHYHPDVATGGMYDWSRFDTISIDYYNEVPQSDPATVHFRFNISDYGNVSEDSYVGLGEYFYSFNYILDNEPGNLNDVIEKFVDSYMAGETPIPCVNCNQTVKFKDMLDFSKSIGCSYLATGHYVKSITSDNETNMYRAVLKL